MNNETQATNTSVDILSESDIGYQYASRGQRFLNLLIDNIFMNYGLSFLTGIVINFVFEIISPDTLVNMSVYGTTEFFLFTFVLGYFNYLVYYTLCEKLFQGRTLGKLITGTKAVRLDGTALTFRDAILRSLCRIVPFEVFSGFGIPWHDSWTNTTVIKTR